MSESAFAEALAARDAARIASLYADAGDAAEETDAACFYWTQAYIWALEAGDPIAARLHACLAKEGREA